MRAAVVGVLLSAGVVVGLLGGTGRLDDSRVHLYRTYGTVGPERSRRGQRVVGALLVVAGVAALLVRLVR